jgi:hypothetical protein
VKQHQRGKTFFGTLILVAFVGLFVFAGIKLAPAYLEYMKVARVLEDLKSQAAGGVAGGPQAIRSALAKRFDIEMVNSIGPRDVEITREGDVFNVRAAYSREEKFVANVSFLLHFDKTVAVPAT